MMPDPIAGNGATRSTAQTYAERLPAKMLGQDEFIKILVAQLTSQDPLNPQKDSDFIGQMAQFSALARTKSMQNQSQTLRANSLIGHSVEVKTEKQGIIIGEVSGVDSTKGEPKIIIDGVSYPVTDVVRVERGSFSAPATNTPATA